jgi:hypothetical protein
MIASVFGEFEGTSKGWTPMHVMHALQSASNQFSASLHDSSSHAALSAVVPSMHMSFGAARSTIAVSPCASVEMGVVQSVARHIELISFITKPRCNGVVEDGGGVDVRVGQGCIHLVRRH